MKSLDRRRTQESGRSQEDWKDLPRDSGCSSADTPVHLFAVTTPRHKTKESLPPRGRAWAEGTIEADRKPLFAFAAKKYQEAEAFCADERMLTKLRSVRSGGVPLATIRFCVFG
jgi:hypothetical protein